MTSEYFWTDMGQADERLRNTVILYDNSPVLVEAILSGDNYDDKIHRISIRDCSNRNSGTSRKTMNSPKFKKFRELPKLGWMNSDTFELGAMFISRNTARTRLHGLSDTNTRLANIRYNTQDGFPVFCYDYRFMNFIYDSGFVNAHKGIYPSLDKILANIKECSSIAYNRNYCVIRDGTGIRWLYRGLDRVGMFTGADTLCILKKFSYLREEIMEDKSFTLNTIREF
jgi:hypothetical protein